MKVSFRRQQLDESLKQLKQAKPLGSLFYGILLQQCAEAGAVEDGRRAFAHAGLASQQGTYVWNRYAEMLVRCGCRDEARAEIGRMPCRNTVSWNILLGLQQQNGDGDDDGDSDALAVLAQMDHEGVRPNSATFLALLRSCCRCYDGEDLARRTSAIEARISGAGLCSDAFVATTLLSSYGKSGRLTDVKRIFSAMNEAGSDVVAWNAGIVAFAQWGQLQEALGMFRGMLLLGYSPTRTTFLNLLLAVQEGGRSLCRAREVHWCVVEAGYSTDLMVATSLIHVYGRCRSLVEARGVFDGLQDRDVVCWNAVVEACCEAEDSRQAVQLLASMDLEGLPPNESTYLSALGSCTAGSSGLVKIIHEAIESSRVQSVMLLSAMASAYAKSGQLDQARRLFEQQPESQKDMISWSTMVLAHAHHGRAAQALYFFHCMDLEGLSPDWVPLLGAVTACSSLAEGSVLHQRAAAEGYIDKQLASALIAMYGRCGSVDRARLVFNEHSSSGSRTNSSIPWTAMIAVYADAAGCSHEAMNIYHAMNLEGLRSNAVTLVKVLDACGDLRPGRAVATIATDAGFVNIGKVRVSMVVMYARCGNLTEARLCFDGFGSSCDDLVAWSALIAAYTRHGRASEALELFGRMPLEGVSMDDVVLVSVLSACGHAGMVAECRAWFLGMVDDFGVTATVEHYGCLVDALARAGMLGEAHELICVMPFEPPATLWIALLGACKTHSDTSRGKRLAAVVKGEFASEYILLSSVVAEEESQGIERPKLKKVSGTTL